LGRVFEEVVFWAVSALVRIVMSDDFDPSEFGSSETVEVNAQSLARLLNEVWEEVGYHNMDCEDDIQDLRDSLK